MRPERRERKNVRVLEKVLPQGITSEAFSKGTETEKTDNEERKETEEKKGWSDNGKKESSRKAEP
jgi:hypothetical protein